MSETDTLAKNNNHPDNPSVTELTISFRTMPSDMEALLSVEKGEEIVKPAMPKVEKLKAPSITLPYAGRVQPFKIEAEIALTTEQRNQVKELYSEAKSLYKRKFYQEAADKFKEVLQFKPYHLRARWFLSHALKKATEYQKVYRQASQESQALTEQLKLAEEKKRTTEQLLIVEKERLKEKEETMKTTVEKLQVVQKEKSTLEEQMQRVQATIAKSQQEAEEKAQQQISEKLKVEEQIKKGMAEKLRLTEQEKAVIEERLRKEQEALVQAQLETEPRQLKLSAILNTKLIKILGLLVLLVIFSTGFIYLVGLWYSKSSQSPPSPTEETAIVLPSPLFSIEDTEIITLKAGQKKNLYQELEKAAAKEHPAGTIVRLIIKIINEDQQERYASFIDFIDSFQVSVPTETLSSLNKNYMLFVYAQKELPASPFVMGLGKNKLGFIVALAEEENIGEAMSVWEKNIVSDLDALFLGRKISFSTDYDWQEISYRDVLIHSVNLPNKFSSLNYTFYKKKLIITTSLESIKAVVDRMTATE